MHPLVGDLDTMQAAFLQRLHAKPIPLQHDLLRKLTNPAEGTISV